MDCFTTYVASQSEPSDSALMLVFTSTLITKVTYGKSTDYVWIALTVSNSLQHSSEHILLTLHHGSCSGSSEENRTAVDMQHLAHRRWQNSC
jgi:hypothetical protein